MPLTHWEIADFAERTMQLPSDMRPFFSRVMEETDDAVLGDHYDKLSSEEPQQKGGRGRQRRR